MNDADRNRQPDLLAKIEKILLYEIPTAVKTLGVEEPV